MQIGVVALAWCDFRHNTICRPKKWNRIGVVADAMSLNQIAKPFNLFRFAYYKKRTMLSVERAWLCLYSLWVCVSRTFAVSLKCDIKLHLVRLNLRRPPRGYILQIIVTTYTVCVLYKVWKLSARVAVCSNLFPWNWRCHRSRVMRWAKPTLNVLNVLEVFQKWYFNSWHRRPTHVEMINCIIGMGNREWHFCVPNANFANRNQLKFYFTFSNLRNHSSVFPEGMWCTIKKKWECDKLHVALPASSNSVAIWSTIYWVDVEPHTFCFSASNWNPILIWSNILAFHAETRLFSATGNLIFFITYTFLILLLRSYLFPAHPFTNEQLTN